MTPRAIRAFIALDHPEEVVEGHFWAPDAEGYTTKPANLPCPFCSEPLELVEAPVFGRICQEQGKRSAAEAPALVELLPATHDALSCAACGIVMTRLKERALA